jgi:hypothetical protein
LAQDLTPDFDHYDNGHDLDPNHGDLEATLEVGDNYLNAEISVLQGGPLSKGCVTAQKQDKDGNHVRLANANTILDTHECTFTFDNGDETVMSANLIAEGMYVQCDPNGNQYVLLDSIINHKRLTLQLDPWTKRLFDPMHNCQNGVILSAIHTKWHSKLRQPRNFC